MKTQNRYHDSVLLPFKYITQKLHTPLGSHVLYQYLVIWPHLIAKGTGKCSLQLCDHLQLQKGKSDNCLMTKYLCYTSFLPTSQIIFISFPTEENQFWFTYSSHSVSYSINCIWSNSSGLWLNFYIFSCFIKAIKNVLNIFFLCLLYFAWKVCLSIPFCILSCLSFIMQKFFGPHIYSVFHSWAYGNLNKRRFL